MDRQLFKENTLRNAITARKRMQHIDFTIVMAYPLDKLLFLKTHQVPVAFQCRHQLIAHLLNVFEMAKRNVPFENIVRTVFTCPFHLSAIQMAVNKAQMGQPRR